MNTQVRSREAELSYQLHRAALPYLRKDWPTVQRTIRDNLDLLNRRPRALLAQGWIREWETALEEGPDALERVAMTPGERGIDLRQVSPLAGVLPVHVRSQIIMWSRERKEHAG